ncbi:MAG TPA: MFS transporter, partial [Micromonosporaceae bacterium]|nr:MFS transporter [Micromonosporaceae bacterium]
MDVPKAVSQSLAGEPASGVSTRRERVGWYFYDWANSAFITTVVTVFYGPFLTAVAKQAAGCAPTEQCADGVIRPLGVEISPGSYFPYVVSASVLLTVFVLPALGGVADRMLRKRLLLAGCAYLGVAATVSMVFVTGDRYLLGGALFIVANIAYGASIVVYNSFLPQLTSPDERDRVSSAGWAIGYLGGGLLLVFNLVAVRYGEGLGFDVLDLARWNVVSAGVWWAAFTLLPLAWLTDRPPVGRVPGNVVAQGFRQLRGTLRNLKLYPLTLFFLLAYLIYNDGIQTVIALASQFGSEELKLPQSALVATVLMVQFLAFGGALLLGALARWVGAFKALALSLVRWVGVIMGAFWLPVGRVVPFVVLGGVIGLVLGGSQALSRSLFSQMIPRGKEAEYFGLYEISDKGTSWLGPLAFGLVFQMTHSYRVGIVSLLTFF